MTARPISDEPDVEPASSGEATARCQTSGGTGRAMRRSRTSASAGACSSAAASARRTRASGAATSRRGQPADPVSRPIATAAGGRSGASVVSIATPGYRVRSDVSTSAAVWRFVSISQASAPLRETTRSSIAGPADAPGVEAAPRAGMDRPDAFDREARVGVDPRRQGDDEPDRLRRRRAVVRALAGDGHESGDEGSREQEPERRGRHGRERHEPAQRSARGRGSRARRQDAEGVDRHPRAPDLEVQVRPGRVAGQAHPPDHLARDDRLAHPDGRGPPRGDRRVERTPAPWSISTTTAPSATRPASTTRPAAIACTGVPSAAAMSSPSWKCA